MRCSDRPSFLCSGGCTEKPATDFTTPSPPNKPWGLSIIKRRRIGRPTTKRRISACAAQASSRFSVSCRREPGPGDASLTAGRRELIIVMPATHLAPTVCYRGRYWTVSQVLPPSAPTALQTSNPCTLVGSNHL